MLLTSPSGRLLSREREGVLLCVLAAASFAGMAVMAKLAYAHGANVVTLLGVRFAIAAVVLWGIAARRGLVRAGARRDVLVALTLGLVVYSAETGLAFGALTRLDASLTELLLFSYPALVVLGGIALRRERASRRTLAALGIATTGVALVLAGSAPGALDPLGTTLALGAAILYAAYALTAGMLDGRLHAVVFAALVCTGAAVAFAAVGTATGSLRLGMSPVAWGWSAAIALGSTVVALTAFLGGVARLGPGRASILGTLEPPFVCVLAFLVFGERLTPLQLAGGALVVSAAVVLQLRRPAVRSRGRDASARPTARPAARALGRDASGRAGVGVRAEMGRLPRDRVRGRERDRAPVARG